MARPKKEKPQKIDGSTLSVFDAINTKFGAGSVIKMDQVPKHQYDVISTGSIGLDKAIGIGGFPRGRIIECYGPESSGKTTLALHTIANAQAEGLVCAFVDAEHALDVKYASDLGVDVPNLLISQPDCGEDALEIVDMMVRSKTIGVIVIDSVAALTPRAELEGEMGQSHVGLQARLMSQALRKLTSIVCDSNTLIIFINQIRMKIGVMFGSPETTTGGGALKFYASIRLDVRRGEKQKDAADTVTANRTRVKVVKNKVAPPFREAEFDLIYGEGISRPGELIEHGVAAGVLEKSGAWISFKNERIGQGLQASRQFLKEHPDVMDAIAEELLAK